MGAAEVASESRTLFAAIVTKLSQKCPYARHYLWRAETASMDTNTYYLLLRYCENGNLFTILCRLTTIDYIN